MRLPKKGFVNFHRRKVEAVSIYDIANLVKSKKISENSEITKEVLENVGLINDKDSQVKLIMARDQIDFKAKIIVDLYSKNAKIFA